MRRSPARSALARRVAAATLAVMASAPAATAAAAQVPGGDVAGSVVDAESLAPLEGAVVVLAPRQDGAFTGAEGGAFLRSTRSLVTGPAGVYRFPDLAAGEYVLHVERLGYRSASIEIRLRPSVNSRVSVGLTVAPIELEALAVSERATDLYNRTLPDADPAAMPLRLSSTRLRQRRFLESDVRALTHGEVLEGITLGEADLFRALQRLPGVTTRDDFSAELWTRGAPWDQTRVYFDGLPLYNPLHSLGLFSGIAPDGVGTAFFHPGVRPARLGDGGAAVVDLRTRPGGSDDGLRGFADLSLTSAKLTMDESFMDGRGAWMVAARRSYIDLLTDGIRSVFDVEDAEVPYAFWDVTARFDYRLSEDRRIETSWLWERDLIASDIPDVIQRTRASWGNLAGRATLLSRLGGLDTRHTLGFSRYRSEVRPLDPDPAVESRFSAPDEPPSDNELVHVMVGSEIGPAAADADWSAGWTLSYRTARFEGPAPLSYLEHRDGLSTDALDRSDDLPMLALWGERDWRTGALTVRTGLRAETGPAVDRGGAVRLAPRVSARLALAPDVSLSAGVARSYQYAQALAPVGPHVERAAASWVWLMANGEGVPALRSDIATLGLEAWLGSSWLAAVNTYARRATGMTIPDPTPGPLVDRPLFVEADNVARGVELSLRRLAGHWTTSLTYSYGESEVEAAGLTFPSPNEHRHAVDATALVRLSDHVRLGAAFTAVEGAPYARVVPQSCDAPCAEAPAPALERPGSRRAPGYASLDLLFDWSKGTDWGRFGLYVQLRNVLAHRNEVTYKTTNFRCPNGGGSFGYRPDGCFDGSVPVPEDEFLPGLPPLPIIGLRASF